MCLSTVKVDTPKGFIHAPCGACIECLQKRRNEWSFRLTVEYKNSTSAVFLTLSYEDEQLPKGMNLSKRDVQLFMKKLRKKQSKISDEKIRYYICGEYGEKTQRPHYHAILFNVKKVLWQEFTEIWGKGHTQVGTCTEASIHYTTKYIIQLPESLKDRERPFSLKSTKPYIGHQYLTKNMTKYIRQTDATLVTKEDGHKQALPRIYKQKTQDKISRMIEGRKAIAEAQKTEKKLQEKAKAKGIDYYKRIHENTVAKTKIAKQQSKSNII